MVQGRGGELPGEVEVRGGRPGDQPRHDPNEGLGHLTQDQQLQVVTLGSGADQEVPETPVEIGVDDHQINTVDHHAPTVGERGPTMLLPQLPNLSSRRRGGPPRRRTVGPERGVRPTTTGPVSCTGSAIGGRPRARGQRDRHAVDGSWTA